LPRLIFPDVAFRPGEVGLQWRIRDVVLYGFNFSSVFILNNAFTHVYISTPACCTNAALEGISLGIEERNDEVGINAFGSSVSASSCILCSLPWSLNWAPGLDQQDKKNIELSVLMDYGKKLLSIVA
jgi:hypothetical protein